MTRKFTTGGLAIVTLVMVTVGSISAQAAALVAMALVFVSVLLPTFTALPVVTPGPANLRLDKPLSDSVTTRKLDLSDGRAKLHWANTNEDGVARYEVQAKDASGAWRAVDSSAPGESRYSATVAKDATCRLVVEMVDGKTHEANF